MSCESKEAADDDGGPPTGRLLAAVLITVGLLGVALNALVIAGVRQAHKCRNIESKSKDDIIWQHVFIAEVTQALFYCISVLISKGDQIMQRFFF